MLELLIASLEGVQQLFIDAIHPEGKTTIPLLGFTTQRKAH